MVLVLKRNRLASKISRLRKALLFYFVANAKDWGKDGIEGNHIAVDAAFRSLVDCKVATARFNNKSHFESFVWIVDVADGLVRVSEFDVGWEFDVAGDYTLVAVFFRLLISPEKSRSSSSAASDDSVNRSSAPNASSSASISLSSSD